MDLSHLAAERRAQSDAYLIWSHEHGAWWAPGGRGYVRDVESAGIYPRSKALEICQHALYGSRGVPNELPVRVADFWAFAESDPRRKMLAG